MTTPFTPKTQADRYAYALWHEQRITEMQARRQQCVDFRDIEHLEERIKYHRDEASRLRNYKEPQ